MEKIVTVFFFSPFLMVESTALYRIQTVTQEQCLPKPCFQLICCASLPHKCMGFSTQIHFNEFLSVQEIIPTYEHGRFGDTPIQKSQKKVLDNPPYIFKFLKTLKVIFLFNTTKTLVLLVEVILGIFKCDKKCELICKESKFALVNTKTCQS